MAALLKSKRFGWAATCALVIVMALVSYVSGRRYLGAVRAVEHRLAVQSAIHATLTLLVDTETGHRGYLLTGEEKFLEPLQWAQRDLPGRFSGLDQLTASDATQHAHVARIRELASEKLAFARQTEALRRAGDREQALAMVRSGRGKLLMDNIRVHCADMLDHEAQLLADRKAEAEQAEKLAVWGIGVGSLLMILVALFSLMTVNRDVQELRTTAEELAKREEHYRLLIEQTGDLVRLLGLDGSITYVSPSVERILGYTVDEYLSISPLSLMHPSEIEVARALLRDIRAGALDSGVSTYRLRHKNGEYRWLEVSWGIIRDSEGARRELHTTGRDVTERRAAEEQLNAYAAELRSLSLRDELTGLYNRRGFLEVARQAHSQALRDQRPAALIFIDLNGMKRINDELGHELGDQALVDAAETLRVAMRNADVIARLGGDEFVVFALDFVAAAVNGLRQRLRDLAEVRTLQLSRPFRLSMSVGVALVGPAETVTLEDLLERADAAMYEQKRARQLTGASVPPPAASAK